MKRILLISTTSSIGGGPMHILNLLKYLKNNFVFFVAIPLNGELANEIIENSNRKFFKIPESRFSIRCAFQIMKFVRLNQIQIIHTHGKGASTYGRFSKFFLKYIRLVHTTHGVHFEKYPKIVRIIYKYYEQFTLDLNNKIIFVSESEKLKLEKFLEIKINNYKIITNGVTIQKKTNLDHSIRFEANKPLKILFIGRLDPIKNVAEFVELVKLCQKLKRDYEFLIIGNGPQKKYLDSIFQISYLPNVKYIGAKRNIFKYLRSADILINCSKSEGHPITLLEAMSLGVICIASNVEGNKDIVDHGMTGYLYPLNDVKKLLGFIDQVKVDLKLANVMKKQSLKKQRKFFTKELCFGAVGKVYDKI